jgi:hypothetical protein
VRSGPAPTTTTLELTALELQPWTATAGRGARPLTSKKAAVANLMCGRMEDWGTSRLVAGRR